jgi:hypothetical protein
MLQEGSLTSRIVLFCAGTTVSYSKTAILAARQLDVISRIRTIKVGNVFRRSIVRFPAPIHRQQLRRIEFALMKV